MEVLRNLPQRTSSSLLYTLRAPPRCWIATAMDVVEPQRPDSGGNDGVEGDCRGRSGTIVNSDSGQEKDNKIYKHKRAEAKQQPNTSSRESVVVEERREQAKEIREKREERKWPETKFNAFYSVPDGRNCRENSQALRQKDERERGEAVSSWWLVASR